MSADLTRPSMSRRGFLRLASLTGGAALLAACQQPQTPAAKPAESKPAAPAAAAPTAAPAKPAESKPAAPSAAAPTTAAAPAKPAEAAKPAAAAAPAAGKRGGVFNYAEAGDFNHFNPWSVTATNQAMYNLAFSRLIWKDSDGKVQGDMAESWESAKDGLSFTAKMKQNVKWHDGKEHVAEDYVKMFGYTKDEALLKDAAIKKHQGYIASVKDVKAVDKYTVRFEFASPTPFMEDIIDYWYAIRIDDPADLTFTKKPPVGTGPFKITEWQPNQFARFQRNADFYVKDAPLVDEVMFKRLEKAETLIPNLQSGGVDAILVTSASDVQTLKANTALALDFYDVGSVFNVQINCNKAPLDKKEVRQALSISMNRAEFAKSAFFGISQPIVSPFYSPNNLAYREDLTKAQAFDLNKAKSMLEAAGVKDLTLTTSVTPRWPQMKLFMLMWQADLQKIGVKLNVNEVEIAKFYDIAADKNMLGNDMAPWLNGRVLRDPAILWSSQANFRGNERNIFGYKNAEMEKLIADAAGETDAAKRKQMYQRLNEIVVEDAYLIHVATNPFIWARKSGVTGFKADLTGNLILTNASTGA